MALDWNKVTPEHVRRALDFVQAGARPVRNAAKGLVVRHGDVTLPAKQVLRVAYCLAAGLPTESNVKFTSGDGTLKLLQSLGFDAFRQGDAA